MEATVTEIAPEIFRISIFPPGSRLSFGCFLIRDEAPAMVETSFNRFFDLVHGADGGLVVMVENLHAGADRHGDEKGDDQKRDGAAQRGFGDEQTPVGRLSKRLSQALDRIRIRRRARNLSRRHRSAPETSAVGLRMSPITPRITSIRIESLFVVESPGIPNVK